jgi:hypothetical protein
MPMERARATEYRSALARCCQAGIDTLSYHASLEFGHRSENVHLQATRRIAFACVDPLRRSDECRAVCFKLTNELREMLQAAAKSIEFVNCEDIYAAFLCEYEIRCGENECSTYSK